MTTRYANGRQLAENTPRGFVESPVHGEATRVLIDTGAFVAADAIGTTLYLARLPSNAVIHPDSKVWFDDFGGTGTMDIGGVNDDDILAADIDVSGAAGSSDLLARPDHTDYGKELWDLFGLTEDPGGNLDIIATIATAAAVNSPDVTVMIKYSV